jgi:predicted DNA-binding transcriptional regulator AlpA
MRTIEGQSAAVPGLLMTNSDVAALLGCSLRQVENLRRSGRIPQPIQLGPNSPRWRRPELLQALGLAENPGVML